VKFVRSVFFMLARFDTISIQHTVSNGRINPERFRKIDLNKTSAT
jgi:hypothetical protein